MNWMLKLVVVGGALGSRLLESLIHIQAEEAFSTLAATPGMGKKT
jgi:hypothetical protein